MPLLRPSNSDFLAFVKAAATSPAGGAVKSAASVGAPLVIGRGAAVRASYAGTKSSPTSSVVQLFGPVTSGPAAFSLTSIPGLALWLDATDASTLSLSGTTVTQWRDKSSNGYTANASMGTVTSSTNLINGMNSIYFPSGSSLLGSVVNTSNAMSMFCVARGIDNITTAVRGYWFFAGPQTFALFHHPLYPSTHYYFSVANTNGEVVWASVQANWSNASVNACLPQIGLASYNGNTYSNAGIALPSGPYSTYLGGAGRGDVIGFTMGELIVCNGSVSDSQRQSIEGYLAWKWGLQASLPGNHLYKSAAP
jgi:hypothetical protein